MTAISKLAVALLPGGILLLCCAWLLRCRCRRTIWRRHEVTQQMGTECLDCGRWRPALALWRQMGPGPKLTAPVAPESRCEDVVAALESAGRGARR